MGSAHTVATPARSPISAGTGTKGGPNNGCSALGAGDFAGFGRPAAHSTDVLVVLKKPRWPRPEGAIELDVIDKSILCCNCNLFNLL